MSESKKKNKKEKQSTTEPNKTGNTVKLYLSVNDILLSFAKNQKNNGKTSRKQ